MFKECQPLFERIYSSTVSMQGDALLQSRIFAWEEALLWNLIAMHMPLIVHCFSPKIYVISQG